ncbi:hypothetical protein [Actinocorallia lasiicapitis]
MIEMVLESVDFDTVTGRPWDRKAGEGLSEVDLHYYLFRSSITFRIGSKVFLDRSQAFPLFDFLASIAKLIGALSIDSAFSITFTESAEYIEFRPSGDKVLVYSSLDLDTAEVEIVELVPVLVDFLKKGRRIILGEVPGISE